MSAETEIRAALASIKKADGQRELIQTQFELARVCSDDNITALLAKIDALQRDAERYRFLRLPENDEMFTVSKWKGDTLLSLAALDDSIDRVMAKSKGGA